MPDPTSVAERALESPGVWQTLTIGASNANAVTRIRRGADPVFHHADFKARSARHQDSTGKVTYDIEVCAISEDTDQIIAAKARSITERIIEELTPKIMSAVLEGLSDLGGR